MYCYHCGYQIDEQKVEAKKPTREVEASSFKDTPEVSYACPRCGWLIHRKATPEELKALSRASHAEIQRGRNSFASGMGGICLGVIALALALLFLKLSFKPGLQNQLVTTCPEFFVSMTLFAVAFGFLSYGIVFAFRGRHKIRKYEALIRDLHNETFVQ